MSIIKRIQHTIFQYNLFERGSKIILAVSGGPDSVFLLDVFSKIRKKYDLELLMVHVNYGLRGRESEKDEELVRKLAERYNIKVFVLKSPYPRAKLLDKMPSENELRQIRYDFFEKVRKQHEFDYIATAHNLDDQVETYLMRIIRGAGLQGLSAIKYKNEKVIRPLLNIKKSEIKAYLKENGLKYRIDKSNLKSVYLRNKVRNQLIPYLEKNFNPRIKETIFSSIETISEDYDLISDLTKKELRKGETVDINRLKKLHPALEKRVIIAALKHTQGSDQNIESVHIAEILKVINSTKNKRQVVTLKGLKIRRIGDRLEIERLK